MKLFPRIYQMILFLTLFSCMHLNNYKGSIDFENIISGQIVFDQYQNQGVIFPTNPIAVKTKPEIFSGEYSLASAPKSDGFHAGPLTILFTAPQRIVSFHVGLDYYTSKKVEVVARAYNKHQGGAQIASSIKTFIGPGISGSRLVSVSSSDSDICRVDIEYGDHGIELIDGLQFDNIGTPLKPDKQPPIISWLKPNEGEKLNLHQLSTPISFSVKEDKYINKIWVTVKGDYKEFDLDLCGNGEKDCGTFKDGSEGNIPVFSGDLELTISVEDLGGNITRESRLVHVEYGAPTLNRYDLLVLAPQMFENRLQRFINFKNSTGMPTTLRTIEDIENSSAYQQGRDIQEKIKLAIEESVRFLGIKYVMLVGDVDQFPVRYVRVWDGVNWDHSFEPSDLYYADIYDSNGSFDNWDANDNGYYGEMNFSAPQYWGEINKDKVDLKPDVGIGRLPVSNLLELDIIVDKIIRYELTGLEYNIDNPVTPYWTKRIMLVTGPFGDSVSTSDNISSLLEPLSYTSIKYYHTEVWENIPNAPPTGNLARAKLLNDEIERGLGFISYIGHGFGANGGVAGGDSGAWVDWYEYYRILNLSNYDKLPIILSSACDTAMFHYPHFPYEDKEGNEFMPPGEGLEPAAVQPSTYDLDTMAEHFMVKHPQGGVAYFGAYTGAQQPAITLVKRFFEEFSSLQGTATLGEVWKGSILRFIQYDFHPYYYSPPSGILFHTIQKMMLFGDPSLRIGGFVNYYNPQLKHPALSEIFAKDTILMHIKYIYRGDPLPFYDTTVGYIIPIEKINSVFHYNPIQSDDGTVFVKVDSTKENLITRIYDDNGNLIVEDLSPNKNKILKYKPDNNSNYILVLSVSENAQFGLYDIRLTTSIK